MAGQCQWLRASASAACGLAPPCPPASPARWRAEGVTALAGLRWGFAYTGNEIFGRYCSWTGGGWGGSEFGPCDLRVVESHNYGKHKKMPVPVLVLVLVLV